MRRYVPQAELVILNAATEFFEQRGDELDAMVFSAEAGSAWSLRYPTYTVVIPQPDVLKAPMAYPLARGDREFAAFLELWIELKKQDNTIAALYDYGILGQNAVPKTPRWSVVRNVFHWVP